MEFSIRILVVIIILLISLVIFLAMIAKWGGEGESIIDSIVDMFKSINLFVPTGPSPLLGEEGQDESPALPEAPGSTP